MEWWRWVLGLSAAVFVALVLAVRFDSLKERPGSTTAQALRTIAPYTAVVPVLFLVALVSPWWLGSTVAAVAGLVLLVVAVSD